MVELQKGAEEIRVGLATLKGTLGVSVPAGYTGREAREVRGITIGSAVTLTCPRCGKVGVLDDDQLHGRVSTKCFNERCDYHETVDWAKRLREAAGIDVGGNCHG